MIFILIPIPPPLVGGTNFDRIGRTIDYVICAQYINSSLEYRLFRKALHLYSGLYLMATRFFLFTIFDCGIYVALLCLLSRELCHIKVIIPALLSKQLLVVSALHYLTMIHNDDLVCILNSG